ncbi:MAG: hypothetical protein HY246_25380 [Proteobacteria bacterium]|nr:hypothetical protein [Pseudomonadota bacterium]
MTGEQPQGEPPPPAPIDFNDPSIFTRALPPARLQEYLIAAGFDRKRAAALYVWDVRVAQEFHMPLHVAEIVIRNALDATFRRLFGDTWPNAPQFVALLDEQRRTDLTQARQRLATQRKPRDDTDRIVAILPFGFWSGMLAPAYGRPIWFASIRATFPDLPFGRSMKSVNAHIQGINTLRNRIYHHKPLIGRDISLHHTQIVQAVGWVSAEIASWLRHHSKVPELIRQRP